MSPSVLQQRPERISTVVLTVAIIFGAVLFALIVLVTLQGPIGLVTFALGVLPAALVVVLIRGVLRR